MIEALNKLKEKQQFLRFKYNIQCIINKININQSNQVSDNILKIYNDNKLDSVRVCFSEKTGEIRDIEEFRYGSYLGQFMQQVHYRCSFDVTSLLYDDFQRIFNQMGQQIVTFLGLEQNFIVLNQISSSDIYIIAPAKQKQIIMVEEQKIHYIYYYSNQDLIQQWVAVDKDQIYDVLASSLNNNDGQIISQCINQLKMRYISVYNHIQLNITSPESIQTLSAVNSQVNNVQTLVNIKNLILWDVKHNFRDLLTMHELQRIYIAYCFTAEDDLSDDVVQMLQMAKGLKYMHIDDDVIQKQFVLEVKISNLEYLRLHFNPKITNRQVYIIKETTHSDKLQICDVKFAEQIQTFQTQKEYNECILGSKM